YLITRENLYSFNITTRVATLIGNMGIPNSLFIDLCFNEGGACYAYDIATNAGYIINPATGAATYLGPLGYLANYAQGMSYDMETSTIYLSAFNFGLNNGELRVMDPGTGATTLLTSWGNQEIAAFALNTTFPAPCTINLPSNPTPQDGAINIPVTGNTVTWTNGTGTNEVEIWFGSVGNVAKVYDGPAINSYTLPTLEYDTKYLWWIICKNVTGKTQGLPWTFTTVQDPNFVLAFYEPFNNLNCWTPIGPFGQINWFIFQSNVAGGSPPTELVLFYDPSFTGLTQLMSCPINSSISYMNHITFMIYYDIFLSAGPVIGVAVTYDDGATSSMLWEELPIGDIIAEQRSVTFTPTSNNYRLIFYLNGNIFLINQWNIDDVQVDYVVPVELISFTGSVSDGQVELNWITSTETNNRGFEVQRSDGGEFETISFVEGHGTTTETQVYSYYDRNVSSGKYSYRLNQIDFDGSFSYSNIIELDVPALSEFKLDQNYPNPFNPSTRISFSLPIESKVGLKVFDVLGQEVATLVNADLAAGQHNIDFDASSLNSGVYVYKIEAKGIDGSVFSGIKKMLLIK
ncbi:MAG: T9SS type A sorting domain-containing protein, partial [Nitrososphaerales archaeon]